MSYAPIHELLQLKRLSLILNCEKGQSLVEYGPIIAIVSIVGILMLSQIGSKVLDMIATIAVGFP